eukprot:6484864-Amphidinium_carterae.5
MGQEVPISAPGVLTPQAGRAIQTQIAAGRVGVAWKRLWSCGVAQATDSTLAQLRVKWGYKEHQPLPRAPDARTARTARHYMREYEERPGALRQHIRRWGKMLDALNEGKALDANGWSRESFRAVAQHPRTMDVVQVLCARYLSDDLPPTVLKLFSTSATVALRKDTTTDAIRPIMIPTVFRKAIATLVVNEYCDRIQRACGVDQYGAKTRDGASSLARAVQEEMNSSDEDTLYMQLDLADAFNSINRESALTALAHP